MAQKVAMGYDENGGISFVKLVNASGADVTGGTTAADGQTAPTVAQDNRSFNFGYNGATYDRLRSAGTSLDAIAALTTGVLHVNAAQMLFNGSTFDRQRKATVFKNLAVSLGVGATTAIWSPAASKKFRLMGIAIGSDVTSNFYVQDGATNIATLKTGAAENSLVVDFGQGILSALANNGLNLFNNGAAALVYITIWGTEE